MFEKHFSNDPTHLVSQALQASQILNANLSIDRTNKVVHNDAHRPGEGVAIISGGGAGHEPSFSGLVGDGMLTAAVTGTIFASPSAKQVLAAVEAQASPKGTLVTVMNYTGDVLNFGVAIEKAKARNPDLPFEMLVVGEDAGVPRSKLGRVGRRGMAGTVLVHKVTGALSKAGYGLQDVAKIGQLVNENMATIGASLDHVHIPGKGASGKNEFALRDNELEIGMGIHNEPGCARVPCEQYALPELVRTLLSQLLDPSDLERGYLHITGSEVILLVNNLGSTSPLELAALVTEVANQLETTYKLRLVRVLCGTLMTSLNGPGFSITVLNAFHTGLQHDLLSLIDAPCEISSWPKTITKVHLKTGVKSYASVRSEMSGANGDTTSTMNVSSRAMNAAVACIYAGLQAVIAREPDITRYDEIVGDGDCGTTLRRGAKGEPMQRYRVCGELSANGSPAVQASLKQRPVDLVQLVSTSLVAVESSMDGTSGALFTIFLSALLQYTKRHTPTDMQSLEPAYWAEALDFGITSLSKYTVAKEGDRTLLDALLPFQSELKATGDCAKAAEAAQKGAEATKAMKASLGRTVYVGGAEQWLGVIPDPGAWGLAAFFSGFAMNSV